MALGISLNLKLKEGEKVTLGQPSSGGSTGLSFTGAVPLNSTVITVSGLSNGKFYVDGIAKTSFTFADYNSGRVQFVHDGSEFAPKFKHSTKIGGVTASFTQPMDSVHFQNVNDAAVIVAKRIAIKEGVLTTLSSSALSIKDAEQSASQLKITLNNSAFDNYEIYKSGALLSATPGQNTFTYADVKSGKIKFRLMTGKYDSATNIAFTVDDQVNAVNSRVDGHILIQVKTASVSVNLAPAVTPSSQALSMAVGGSSRLSTASFATVSDDHGTPPAGILVTITKSAGVYFTIDGVKTSTFTMQDVAEGLVFINHNAQWTSSLDFILKFTDDMGKSSATYTSSQLFLGGLNLAAIDVSGDNANDNVVEENGTLTGDLNASVAAQPSLTFKYVLKTQSTFGTVTITDADTGAFSYINTNSADTDSFVVTVTASNGMTVDQVVIIDIVPENEAPFAPNVDVTIDEDSVKAITILGTDKEGSQLTYSVTTGPVHGAVVAIDANGHFSYTHNGELGGDDSFVVTVKDAGNKSYATTVTIDVNPINDAPVFTSPTTYTIDEDASLTGHLSASDVDSPNLRYGKDLDHGPSHGALDVNEDGSFTYTPTANFAGTDSFVVSVTDNTVTTFQTITVTVTEANVDAPTDLLLTPSSVLEGAIGVDIGTLLGVDPDLNSSFTYELVNTSDVLEIVTTLVGSSTISTLKLKPGKFLDNTLDNGSDDLLAVQINVYDGTFTTSQTVTINIRDALRGPVFTTTSVSTNEDTAVTGNILATTAPGEAGGTITYTTVTGPAHANSFSLNSNGSYSYIPTANFNGSDSFVVRATSGSGNGAVTSIQTVTVTVNPVNDLPSLSVSSFSVAEKVAGGSTIATLLSSDVDANETASFFISSDLSGKFEIVGSSLRLKADASLDFESQSLFSLTVGVTDSTGASAYVPVSIQVTDVNEAPLSISLIPKSADSTTGLAIVNENLPGGEVGTLSAIDSDNVDSHVFSVNDSRFEVVNNVLKLKNANALDFELIQSLSVTVTATDSGGLRVSQSFTILVGDQDDLPHADILQLNLDERIRNSDGSYAVTNTMLHASMAHKDPSVIVFKITSLPNASTYFRLNGVKVAEFTQADVDAGKVSIVLDGTSLLPEIKISVGYRDVSGSGFGTADYLPVEFTYGGFNSGTLLDLNYDITHSIANISLGRFLDTYGHIGMSNGAEDMLRILRDPQDQIADAPEAIYLWDNLDNDNRTGNILVTTLDDQRGTISSWGGEQTDVISTKVFKSTDGFTGYVGTASAGYRGLVFVLQPGSNSVGVETYSPNDPAYQGDGIGGAMDVGTFTGPAGSNFGVAAADAGDFDNRGDSEIIIGANLADPLGRTDAGAAFLYWSEGHATFAEMTAIAVSLPNPTTTDEKDYVRILGAQAGDQFGSTIGDAWNASRDANNDSFSDLLISAPKADPSSLKADAGVVYLLRGQSVLSTVDLANINTEMGIKIKGASAGDQIGSYLSFSNLMAVQAADTDKSEYLDAVIAAKDADVIGSDNKVRVDAGAVYIVKGGASIFSRGDIDLAASFDGVTIIGAKAGDHFGTAVQILSIDINNDGTDDLIIGAPDADVNGKVDAGAVYVIYGSALISGSKIDIGNLSLTQGFVLYGAKAGDHFGYDVALSIDAKYDLARDPGQTNVPDLMVTSKTDADGNAANGFDGVVTIFDGELLRALGGGKSSFGDLLTPVSFAGDDTANTFTINANQDYLVGAQGRGGFDTLVITGENAKVEIQRFQLSGIDVIDLTVDATAQEIIVDRRDVVDIVDNYLVNDYSAFVSWLNTQNNDISTSRILAGDLDGFFNSALRIKQTAADKVTLSSFHKLTYADSDNGGVVADVQVTKKEGINDVLYDVWQSNDDASAIVLIQYVAPYHAPHNLVITDNLNPLGPIAISENAKMGDADPRGAIVGTITVSDEDVGDTHTFTVKEGGILSTRFEVVTIGNVHTLQLKAGMSVDRETEPTISVDVVAQDNVGATYSETFTVTVQDDPTERLPIINKDTLFITENLRVNSTTLVTTAMINMSANPETHESDDQLLIRIDQLPAGTRFNYTDGDVVCLATSNLALFGRPIIDGVTLLGGERVLVVGQANASEDGLYIASTGAWTRVSNEGEVVNLKGDSYRVTSGLTHGGHSFALSSDGLGLKETADAFTYAQVVLAKVYLVSDGAGIAPEIKVSFGASTSGFNSSDYLAIEIRPQNYNLANAFDLNYKVTGSGGEGVGVVLKEVTDINGNVTDTLIFNNNGTIYDVGARADFPEDINIWDNLDSDNRTDSTDFGLHADGLDSSRGGSVGHPIIGRQVQMDFFDTYWADPNDVDPVNPNDPNNPDTLDNGAYNDRINFWITISGNRILFDADTDTNGTVTAVIPVNADNGPGGNNEGFPGNRINYDGINFNNDLDGFRGENGILTLPFEATSVANIGDYDNRGQDDLVIGMAGADVLGRVDAGGAFVLFSEGRRAVDDFTDYNGDGELDGFNDVNGNGILDIDDINETLNALGQEPTYYNDASPYITNPSWGSRADGDHWSPFFSALPTTDHNQFVQILGAAAGDRAGTAASGAGDTNHDGFDDFMLSASGADVNGKADAGVVYLLRGQSVRSTIDLNSFNSTLGIKIRGDQVNGQIGNELLTDDIDNDGYADLIISGQMVDGYDGTSELRLDSGTVYLVWGRSNIFSADINLDPTAFINHGIRIVGAADGDMLGSSIVLMDLNGDGDQDLVISASNVDYNGQANVGAIYVIWGGEALRAGGTIDLAHLGNDQGFVIYGGEANEHFGNQVSRGADLNSDGFDELLVSSAKYNNNDGRVHVLDGALLDGMFHTHSIGYTGTNSDDTFSWNSNSDYLIGFEGRSGLDTLVITGSGNKDAIGTHVVQGLLVQGDGINDTVEIQRFQFSGLDVIDLATDTGRQRLELDRRDAVNITDAYSFDDYSNFIEYTSNTAQAALNFSDSRYLFESALRIKGGTNDVVDFGRVAAFITPDDEINSRNLFRKLSFAPVGDEWVHNGLEGARTYVTNEIDGVTYDVWQSRIDTNAIILVQQGIHVITAEAINTQPFFLDISPLPLAVNEDDSLGLTYTSDAFEFNAGDILTYSVGTADHGTVTINANTGVWTYTPTANYHGTDTFTLAVSDGIAVDNLIVNITVNSVNDAPLAANKTISTPLNTAYTFTAADFGFSDANDLSPNALLSVIIDSVPDPAFGSLRGVFGNVTVPVNAGDEIDADELPFLQFVPANGVGGNGVGNFTFHVRDDGGTATVTDSNGVIKTGVDVSAVHTITVNVPLNQAPLGADKTITSNVNTAYTFSAADFGFTDVDGHSLLNVIIDSLPLNGSLTFWTFPVDVDPPQAIPFSEISHLVFTPATGGVGAEYAKIAFRVQDNGGTSPDTAAAANTLTFNVVANQAPQGTDKPVDIAVNADYTFSAADFGFSDTGNSPAHSLLSVKIKSLPGTGTLKLNGVAVVVDQEISAAQIGLLVFSPATGISGSPSFTFAVRDNGGTAASGADTDASPNIFTLNVISPNDAPLGTDKTVTTAIYTPKFFSAADFGFTDPNDTPANAFSKVIIDSVTLSNGGTLKVNLGAGLVDALGQTITVAQIPTLVFTSDIGEGGAGYARFTFRVQDDGGTSFGGVNTDPVANTIIIDVDLNTAPAGISKTVITNISKAYTFSAADFGFTDADGNTLSKVIIGTPPVLGRLTLADVAVTAGQVIDVSALGTLVYTPVLLDAGSAYASFDFRVQDNGDISLGGANVDASPNTITIDVVVNQAPRANNKLVTAFEDGSYTFAVSDFAFADDDTSINALKSLQITSVTAGQGTLKLNGVAVTVGTIITAAQIPSLVYTPALHTKGSAYASFKFMLTDDGGTAGGGVDTDATPNTIIIDVTNVNHAPAGTDNTITAIEDTFRFFTLADFGFTDPNDTPADSFQSITITGLTLPAGTILQYWNGTASVDVNLQTKAVFTVAEIPTMRFQGATNANGLSNASIQFTVTDNGGGATNIDASPNTLTINVIPVNDAPTGANQTADIAEDRTYTFASDRDLDGDIDIHDFALRFGFADASDSPTNSMEGIILVSLPEGILTAGGRVLRVGDDINLMSLSNLIYTPDPNWYNKVELPGVSFLPDSFQFQVRDKGGTANGGVDISLNTYKFDINVHTVNDAPSGADNTVTASEDEAYSFKDTDFGFTDPNDTINPDPDEFFNVIVTSLATRGTLKLNGVEVAAGDVISVGLINLGAFTFTGELNDFSSGSDDYATFSFQVQDKGGLRGGAADFGPADPANNRPNVFGAQDTDQTANTLHIRVTAVNDIVLPADLKLNAVVNTPLTGTALATKEFGSLTYIVTNVDGLGTATIDDQTGAWTFDPGGTAGADSFTIQAMDGNGAFSNLQKVDITIV